MLTKLISFFLFIAIIAIVLIYTNVYNRKEIRRKGEVYINEVMNEKGHHAQLRKIFYYYMDYPLTRVNKEHDEAGRSIFQEVPFMYAIGDFWISGGRHPGMDRALYLEICGNEHRADNQTLTDHQNEKLLSLGWKSLRTLENSEYNDGYYITWASKTPEDQSRLITFLEKTMALLDISKYTEAGFEVHLYTYN